MACVLETIYDTASSGLIPQGQQYVPCDWRDLVRSAATVGRRSRRDVLRFGVSSWIEIIWRAALVGANLDVTPHHVQRSAAFDALDGSEKGAVTYFLGLTMAKLAAERHCRVPWLMHHDVYTRSTNPYGRTVKVSVPAASRRRPDLIGLDLSGNWLVMEAKGRTGHVGDDLRLETKNRTGLISTIEGSLPQWRIGVIARFDHDRLAVDLIDPADPAPDAEPIDLPPDRLLRDYYAPIRDFLREESTIDEVTPDRRRFVVREVRQLGISIGLDERIVELMDRREPGPEPTEPGPRDTLYGEILRLLGEAADTGDGEREHERRGLDGILVRLSDRWHRLVERP